MVGGNLIKVNGAKSFTIDIVLLLNVIRNYNPTAKQLSSEPLYKKINLQQRMKDVYR